MDVIGGSEGGTFSLHWVQRRERAGLSIEEYPFPLFWVRNVRKKICILLSLLLLMLMFLYSRHVLVLIAPRTFNRCNVTRRLIGRKNGNCVAVEPG